MTHLGSLDMIKAIGTKSKKHKIASLVENASSSCTTHPIESPVPQFQSPSPGSAQQASPATIQQAYETFRTLASAPRRASNHSSGKPPLASQIHVPVAPSVHHANTPTAVLQGLVHQSQSQKIPGVHPYGLHAPSKTATEKHRRMIRKLMSTSSDAHGPPKATWSERFTGSWSQWLPFTGSSQSSSLTDPEVIAEFDRDISRVVTHVTGRWMGLSDTELQQSPALRQLVSRNMRWFQHTPDWMKLMGIVVAKKVNSLVGTLTPMPMISELPSIPSDLPTDNPFAQSVPRQSASTPRAMPEDPVQAGTEGDWTPLTAFPIVAKEIITPPVPHLSEGPAKKKQKITKKNPKVQDTPLPKPPKPTPRRPTKKNRKTTDAITTEDVLTHDDLNVSRELVFLTPPSPDVVTPSCESGKESIHPCTTEELLSVPETQVPA